MITTVSIEIEFEMDGKPSMAERDLQRFVEDVVFDTFPDEFDGPRFYPAVDVHYHTYGS